MNNLTKLARRQLATHEALRRLGFGADDIYLRFTNPVGGGIAKVYDVFTELRVGELTFRASFPGEKKVSKEAYETVYQREGLRWNDPAHEAENLAAFQREFPVPVLASLTRALQAKGFTVPNIPQAITQGDI